MSKRPRRKSTIQPSLVDVDSEDDVANQSETSKARNIRMSHADEEILLLTCVKYFDEINDTSTIRGIPGSKVVKERQQREERAWQNITDEMNGKSAVSNEFITFAIFFVIICVFFF